MAIDIIEITAPDGLASLSRDLGSAGIRNPIETSIFTGRRIPAGWYAPFFPLAAPLRDLKTGEAITLDERGMISATEFKWWGYDVSEAIEIADTRLSSEAPYHGFKIKPKQFTGSLEFRGAAARLPWDEIAYFEGEAFGRYLLDNQLHPARMVDLDIQKNEIKPLLTANGSFGTNTAKAGGQEWDTGGDMKTDVTAAALAIWNATGIDKLDLQLVLTQTSYAAAQLDTGFIEFAKNIQTGSLNGRGWDESPAMANYLGIGSVRVLKVAAEIGIHSLDTGWLLPIPGSQSSTGTAGDPAFSTGEEQMWDYGSSIWGAGFAPVGSTDGYTMPYIDDRMHRVRYHPFHRYYRPVVIRKDSGVKFTNLKS